MALVTLGFGSMGVGTSVGVILVLHWFTCGSGINQVKGKSKIALTDDMLGTFTSPDAP